MIMDNLFHSDVENDFVEYFLHDLLINMIQLNDLLVALTKETSEQSRQAIFKRLADIREIINEEIYMFNQLLNFRKLTTAEEKVADEAEMIRKSTYIVEFEKEIIKERT
jgi:hypothetical protein